MLEPIFDHNREILHPDDANALLLALMESGSLGALFIDMQWGYFFPEYMRGRFTEAAIAEAQAVTATTHGFLHEFEDTGVSLSKFWAVHACFPSVRHKLETDPKSIRRELVIRPASQDGVFAKDEPCPFYKTPLLKLAREQRLEGFLIGGGLFEVCVAHGLLNGMHEYDFNFFLMPDATLTKHGRGAEYIKAQFEHAHKGATRIKLAVMDTREVLAVARSASQDRMRTLTAA